MKINVFICSEDVLYCEKLVNYFNSHYYDKFQWNVYTDSSYLPQIFRTDAADLILVGGEMQAQMQELDGRWTEGHLWAYLTEEAGGQEEGRQYIEKYRRADRIYRDLLDLYAKKEHVHYENLSIVSGKTSFLAFVSAGGGTGASTLACAAAKACCRMEKVLYFNLENLGSCGLCFTGEEKPGLDELVYAIKSRRNTLELKIESSVSRDESGVYYFKECENPMDLQTVSPDDMKELLKAIETSKTYDKVVIDLGNGIQDREVAVLSMANRIVMVAEQGEPAERKLQRYLEYMQTVEETKQVDIISKMQIYFNKTLKSACLPEQVSQVRIGGAFPLIENGDFAGIVNKLADMELLQGMR